jgi:hypothetical protein
MQPGSTVKIKNTDKIATVIQIGIRGLLMLSSKDFHAFDRTVYGPWEVEEIKNIKKNGGDINGRTDSNSDNE